MRKATGVIPEDSIAPAGICGGSLPITRSKSPSAHQARVYFNLALCSNPNLHPSNDRTNGFPLSGRCRPTGSVRLALFQEGKAGNPTSDGHHATIKSMGGTIQRRSCWYAQKIFGIASILATAPPSPSRSRERCVSSKQTAVLASRRRQRG